MNALRKYFGPSTLIAAAFIGPGTITTCTLAGVNNGYSLLWALAFSCIATIVLQEMSARVGIITQQGLGETIHHTMDSGIKKTLLLVLIFSAILIGNAAYESGNITGAALGLELILGDWKWLPLLVGAVAFIMMYIGSYKFIEYFLIGLVILMSLCFLITALLVTDDYQALFAGFIPTQLGKEDLLLSMALIGTTVVPYNLFLHTSIVSKKWKSTKDIHDLRKENRFSIILGSLISAMVLIVAAASQGKMADIKNAQDLAVQLNSFVGSYSNYLMGFGLLAAGLSSALTAALAAAYVAKGLFKSDEKSILFKGVWIAILSIGTLVSLIGFNNILLIKFAQVTNAILLPVIAIFLIYSCQSVKLLGDYKNSKKQNIVASLVMIIILALSFKTLWLLMNN